MMTKEDLKDRTKRFALSIIRFVDALPRTKTGQVIEYQILKSGTSVAANYRAACRSRSPADFISKISIVEEECDETLFWLEVINEAGLVKSADLDCLLTEADELTAIFTSSGRTAKKNFPK